MSLRSPIFLQTCYAPYQREAGVDEAGRGCLAGPVMAAAVVLPPDFAHPWLRDSKQMSRSAREALRPLIETQAFSWGLGEASPAEIDRLNILQATFLAMHRAIAQLTCRPDLLLVDGNRFRPYPLVAHQCIVRGDATFMSIAAASVLAKTHRDARMYQLDAEYPAYGWAQNAGYPTRAHQQALRQHGPSPHHRQSFRLQY